MTNTINDPRLAKNALGFYEIANKPTVEELQAFYVKQYYQEEHGNYRSSYPENEVADPMHKIKQWHHGRNLTLLVTPAE